MSSFLGLERKQKNSSNVFWIRIFLLLYHSTGIETITTFTPSGSSLENHTRFQTEKGKAYPRFQTKKAQKPYALGRHILIWFVWGESPLPGNYSLVFSLSLRVITYKGLRLDGFCLSVSGNSNWELVGQFFSLRPIADAICQYTFETFFNPIPGIRH